MQNQGFTPKLPGSEATGQTREDKRAANRARKLQAEAAEIAAQGREVLERVGGAEKSGGPQGSPVTGHQHAKGETPSRTSSRTPSQQDSPGSLQDSGGTVDSVTPPAPILPGRSTGGSDWEGKRVGDGTPGPGRPSSYTEEEGDAICAWVAAGGSLNAYSRRTGRKLETLYRWMRQDAGFQARYARACEDRADTLVDDMLEIADDAAGENCSIEGVAAAKLRIEARKWIATKLRPSKWGDKQIIEQTGSVSIRIGIPAKPAQAVQMVEQVAPVLLP